MFSGWLGQNVCDHAFALLALKSFTNRPSSAKRFARSLSIRPPVL